MIAKIKFVRLAQDPDRNMSEIEISPSLLPAKEQLPVRRTAHDIAKREECLAGQRIEHIRREGQQIAVEGLVQPCACCLSSGRAVEQARPVVGPGEFYRQEVTVG
jgi:hypothetical protein